MVMRLVFLFLACLLWAGAASAAEVRFPETGGPAFAFELPVEWVTATDNDKVVAAKIARRASEDSRWRMVNFISGVDRASYPAGHRPDVWWQACCP